MIARRYATRYLDIDGLIIQCIARDHALYQILPLLGRVRIGQAQAGEALLQTGDVFG